MNQGKYVCSQLTDFLPKRVIDYIAEVYASGFKTIYPTFDTVTDPAPMTSPDTNGN
jgi:hypothetical protein